MGVKHIRRSFKIKYSTCYNVHMITDIERAQIIIEVLKARVHELEEALLSEQVNHSMTRLSYQKSQEESSG